MEKDIAEARRAKKTLEGQVESLKKQRQGLQQAVARMRGEAAEHDAKQHQQQAAQQVVQACRANLEASIRNLSGVLKARRRDELASALFSVLKHARAAAAVDSGADFGDAPDESEIATTLGELLGLENHEENGGQNGHLTGEEKGPEPPESPQQGE